MMKDIQLFDYQKDMKSRIEKALCLHRSVMVQMPTGTGKTVLLASVVEAFLREHPNSSVWIVAHRRELVSQIQETLNKFLLNFNFSKTHPSSLTLKGGSTSIPKPLSPQEQGDVAGDAIALPEFLYRQQSFRPQGADDGFPTQQSCDCLSAGASKVSPDCLMAGASKVSPDCLCGVNRLADNLAMGTESVKAVSIQWLSKHYRELKEKPSLIVIDEAHHALAETYAEVMNAYPKAKKLGLTATPYRMNGKGFTDLFDTLLCSWSMERFIAEGRLSLYDYYSIKPDSADQLLIDSLQKRGADGDYQQKELNEVMDVRPSLERLCLTIKRYVPGKKGIVYAISIQHAEHIAEFYRENGIKAVAISSKTPSHLRKELIEKFKSSNTSDEIQVLVSVDLFSEGFDCPDVEFIQLARPTLSLAKYMQMVGRGLRVAEGKDCCVILDNVGLYKRFGLPSVDRDWQSMFEGKSSLENMLQEVCLNVNSHNCWMDMLMNGDGEMMKIVSHERLQRIMMDSYGYSLVENEKGLLGIKDNDGNIILDCLYKKIEVTNDGFAYCYIRKKAGRKEWLDLRNGLWFMKKPQSVKLLGIDFSTEDGKKLYPRIRSKFIDEKAFLTVKTLELQVGAGLIWKRRFIPWDEPNKVYYYKEGMNDLRLYYDDEENYVAQENIGSTLIPVPSQEFMENFCRQCAEKYEKEQVERKELERTAGHYDTFSSTKKLQKEGRMEKDGILYIKHFYNQKEAWIDMVTNKIFMSKPTTFKRGFVNLVKEGDWCYIRNIPELADTPFRPWEIRADDNICVINNEFLVTKIELLQWFKIVRRTDDFSYFVVEEYSYKYHYIQDDTEIQITQFDGDGLKMTKEGMPYTPFVFRGCAADRHKWD